MIELSKEEVTALLLNQKFYTYYETSDTKITGKYFAVSRKVLNREDLKITVYYEQRKPTWFTKLLRFSVWDVTAVDMPAGDIEDNTSVVPKHDSLKNSPNFRGFHLKTLKDILKTTS